VIFRPSEFRSVSGLAPLVQPLVVPPDGQKMWLVQPGIGWGDNSYPSLIELMDVTTGEVLLQTELGPNTHPVGATYSGLVLESVEWIDTGGESGFVTEPGSEEALLLTEDGILSVIGPGHVVEAGADTIVRLGCAEPGGCPLTITNSDGSNERLAPVPIDGRWMHLGGPGIPSTSLPMSALSPNGSSMVMGIGDEFDVNDVPAELTVGVIDVTAGTTSLRGDLGPGLVTWSRDSDWLAVIGNEDVSLISVDINKPEETAEVEGVIPEGHFPLTAG
jgi:hypothetical protein